MRQIEQKRCISCRAELKCAHQQTPTSDKFLQEKHYWQFKFSSPHWFMSHSQRQGNRQHPCFALHPPLSLPGYKDLTRNHWFNRERANLFSQFKFFWAHGADYSKLINRHVMNKNTLIMKRGCPMPPFRLVISMRTHVVNSWSIGTTSPRQPQMPSLD